MTWVKLDDTQFMNPKIGAASLEALGVYMLGLTYAAHNLTNGKIPASAFHIIRCTPQLCHELVTKGLWDQHKDGTYSIHDYLKFNPSKRKVLQERKKTRARVDKHRNATVTPLHRRYTAVNTDAPVPVPEKNHLTDIPKLGTP